MSWMEESPVTAHKVDIKLSRGRRNQGKKIGRLRSVVGLLLSSCSDAEYAMCGGVRVNHKGFVEQLPKQIFYNGKDITDVFLCTRYFNRIPEANYW